MAELVPEVLARLAAVAPLPENGVVAGQAVASVYSELLGVGTGPINDVDVFCYDNESNPTSNIRVRGFGANIIDWRYTDPGVYDHMVFHLDEPQSYYGVGGVTRSGLLNVVSIFFGDNLDPARFRVGASSLSSAFGHVIIQGFDLNCTGVGITLDSHELVVTRDFLDFLATKQLRVTQVHTPAHTAIRLAKKTRDIPWAYVDLDAEMTLLACAIATADTAPRKRSVLFTSVHKRRFKAVSRIAGQYFRLRRVAWSWGLFRMLYTLKAKPSVDLDFATFIEQHHLPTGVVPTAYRLLSNQMSHKYRRKFDIVAQSALLLQATLAHGPAFLKGNIAPAHVAQVDKLFGEHRRLAWVLTRYSSFETIYRVTRLLRGMEKKYGLWVIGEIETRPEGDWILNGDWLDKAFSLASRRMREPKVERWVDNTRVGEFIIHELVSVAELRIEGDKQRHCVGGYGNSLSDSRRILSIWHTKDPAIRSTAEIRFSDLGYTDAPFGRWTVVQHRGRQNVDPHPEARKALGELVAILPCPVSAAQSNKPAIRWTEDEEMMLW